MSKKDRNNQSSLLAEILKLRLASLCHSAGSLATNYCVFRECKPINLSKHELKGNSPKGEKPHNVLQNDYSLYEL